MIGGSPTNSPSCSLEAGPCYKLGRGKAGRAGSVVRLAISPYRVTDRLHKQTKPTRSKEVEDVALHFRTFYFYYYYILKNIRRISNLAKLILQPSSCPMTVATDRHGPQRLQVLQCPTTVGHGGYEQHAGTVAPSSAWAIAVGSVCFRKIAIFLRTRMKVKFIWNL
jgi:hypothetical protein